MNGSQSSQVFGLLTQVAEWQDRERNLLLLLGKKCPGVREEAAQELAATRMLLQAAEENLAALPAAV